MKLLTAAVSQSFVELIERTLILFVAAVDSFSQSAAHAMSPLQISRAQFLRSQFATSQKCTASLPITGHTSTSRYFQVIKNKTVSPHLQEAKNRQPQAVVVLQRKFSVISDAGVSFVTNEHLAANILP